MHCCNTHQEAPHTSKQMIRTRIIQYSAIRYTQNMHVEWKSVTDNPQMMRKLKGFVKIWCICNTGPKLALQTLVMVVTLINVVLATCVYWKFIFTVRLQVMQCTVLLSQFSLSVCQMHVLWQNKIIICQYVNTVRNRDISSPSTPAGVAGNCPLPPEIFAKSDSPLRKIPTSTNLCL